MLGTRERIIAPVKNANGIQAESKQNALVTKENSNWNFLQVDKLNYKFTNRHSNASVISIELRANGEGDVTIVVVFSQEKALKAKECILEKNFLNKFSKNGCTYSFSAINLAYFEKFYSILTSIDAHTIDIHEDLNAILNVHLKEKPDLKHWVQSKDENHRIYASCNPQSKIRYVKLIVKSADSKDLYIQVSDPHFSQFHQLVSTTENTAKITSVFQVSWIIVQIKNCNHLEKLLKTLSNAEPLIHSLADNILSEYDPAIYSEQAFFMDLKNKAQELSPMANVPASPSHFDKDVTPLMFTLFNQPRINEPPSPQQVADMDIGGNTFK